jgi:hypothetical protein
MRVRDFLSTSQEHPAGRAPAQPSCPPAFDTRARVVELRERGEHALHQFPGGRVIDRFRRGPQRAAERLQQGAER